MCTLFFDIPVVLPHQYSMPFYRATLQRSTLTSRRQVWPMSLQWLTTTMLMPDSWRLENRTCLPLYMNEIRRRVF